jgi:type I site-specific restriction endonuclease
LREGDTTESSVNKKDLSERDICSKFIGPAVKRAGWDGMMQIREEVAFTKGAHHRPRKTGHAREAEARRLHPLLQAQYPDRRD